MQKKTQWTIGGGVPLVVAFITIWNWVDPWPNYGWETPNAHASDISVMKDEHSENKDGWKNFRDEWKCDEYDEELRELLREQSEIGGPNVNTDLDEDILRLRVKMGPPPSGLNCSRFDN